MDQDGADACRVVLGVRAAARLPRPVGAVVFDLDGTLLDTEPVYRAAFYDALQEFGVGMARRDYEKLVGLPSTARRPVLRVLLGDGFPVAAFLDAYYRRRAARLADGVALKPGVDEALDAVARSGLPAGVATSASAATARDHLARAGLLRRFAAVVTRDDVAHGKPRPDSFVRAAGLLGVPPADCLAVEDSPAGVSAAYGSGMMVCLIPDTVACGADIVRCCDARLDSLHGLAPLLSGALAELCP